MEDAMTLDGLIDEVLRREGGFSDDPADRGGETRYGITAAVARAHGYAGPMRSLPIATARQIYRATYWERPRLDAVAKLAPNVAAILFDTGVNMGTTVAVSFLQRALNALNRGARDYPDVQPDGVIGTATLAALAGFLTHRGSGGDAVLGKAVEALRGERYVALAEARPANETFLYGWLSNRMG
jgi:lysozyme family protein